jgi:hypothetical protein
MERGGVGEGQLGLRRDWALRARKAVGPHVGEMYAGATTLEDEGDLVIREGTPQAGVRLRSTLAAPVPVEAAAALRFRSHPRLPAREAEVALRTAPLAWLALEGELMRGWWDDAGASGRWAGSARVGPVLGLSAFGSVFGSAPGAGGAALRVRRAADSLSFALDRDGSRVGVQFAAWGGSLGVAALRIRADTVTGFGLPFDSAAGRFSGGAATGLEASVSLPTGWDPLRLEAWYVGMEPDVAWPYLPDDHWRAALVYHHLPLPSGNLELYARVEHLFRGRMAVPGATALAETGAYRATNLELTIRVLTVRAFLRWDNLFHRRFQQDVLGFELPGQHVFYGVKWEFTN